MNNKIREGDILLLQYVWNNIPIRKEVICLWTTRYMKETFCYFRMSDTNIPIRKEVICLWTTRYTKGTFCYCSMSDITYQLRKKFICLWTRYTQGTFCYCRLSDITYQQGRKSTACEQQDIHRGHSIIFVCLITGVNKRMFSIFYYTQF